MHCSKRLRAVQAPIIPTIRNLIADYPGTISFGQGIAFYVPPKIANSYAKEALKRGDIHRYGPVEGTVAIQAALQRKLKMQNNFKNLNRYKIVVTAGSNMAFSTAVLAIADPQDEIILPLPYYFNHEMAITMYNCKTVVVPTDASYHLDIGKLEQAITNRTRAIATTSPNNPTGAVYTKQELTNVNKLCKKHKLFHISDEAYEDFVFNNKKHYSPGSAKGSEEFTISLYSLSKAFGFAGWRIGYMVIPKSLDEAVNKIQDTILISPPMISQHAAIGALTQKRSFVTEKLDILNQRREYILSRLKQLSDLIISPKAEGAFYIFLQVNLPANDLDLVHYLIKRHKVALIPGSAFGMTDNCYLRLSYGALNDREIKEGLDRFINGLHQYSKK